MGEGSMGFIGAQSTPHASWHQSLIIRSVFTGFGTDFSYENRATLIDVREEGRKEGQKERREKK